MEIQSTSAQPFNLQARITNILTKPKQEWPVIAAEPRDIAGLYSKYIVLLAAIGPICTIIGQTVFGISVPFLGTYRPPIVNTIVSAIFQYVMVLVGVYISAFIVAKLAPSFQSEPDVAQAAKLVAYSWTPAWIAGVLYIIPMLSPLVLLASLYSIYLMYLGTSPMMKTPADKVIVYMVVAFIVSVVVFLVLGLIVGMIVAAIGFGTAAAYSRPAF